MDCLLYRKTKVRHLYFPKPFSASINWEAIVDDLNRFVNNHNANRRPSRRRARRVYTEEDVINEEMAHRERANARERINAVALEHGFHQLNVMDEDGVQMDWIDMEDLHI